MADKIQKRICYVLCGLVNEISNKKWAKNFPFSIICVIVFLYAGMQLLGITCPIKYLTGISCAGCGMTRAYLALLRLDLSKAFYYHPLFFLPPIFLVLDLKKASMKKSIYNSILFLFAIIFLAVYLYRMFNGDKTVVVYQPKDGLFFRFIITLMEFFNF